MVQPMVSWLHCFWVMVRQIVMAEGHGAKLLTPWWLGSRGWKALGTKVHLSRHIFWLGPRAYFPAPPNNATISWLYKDESVDEARAPVTQSCPRAPPLNLLHYNIGASGEQSRFSSELPTHSTWPGEEREGKVLPFPTFTDAEMFWLRN